MSIVSIRLQTGLAFAFCRYFSVVLRLIPLHPQNSLRSDSCGCNAPLAKNEDEKPLMPLNPILPTAISENLSCREYFVIVI